MGLKKKLLQDDELDPLDETISPDDVSTDEPDTSQEVDKEDAVSPLDDESDDEADDASETPPVRPSRITSRLAEMFGSANDTPTGPANTKYRQFLDEGMPTEQPPSKLNRLASILGGMSEGYFHGAAKGIRAQEEIQSAPYDRQVRDFTNKAKVLQAGAALEDKELGRKASFAKSAVSSINAEDKNANDKTRIEAQTAHWNASDKASAARAATAGFTHVQAPDGHLYFEKPNADGSVLKIDGGKTGESIPEKSKRILDTFKTEEDIRQKGRITLQGAREDREDARNKSRIDANANKPAQQAAEIHNALDTARQDPANIKAVKDATGRDINEFIDYQKNASGQNTGKILGLKMPHAYTTAGRKADQAIYDQLWQQLHQNEE